GRAAFREPQLVVEIVSPTADLALVVHVEHADAGQLESPSFAVEIPTVETLRADRLAATEDVAQLPLDPLRALEDPLDDFPHVVETDDRLERLVDVHDVRGEAGHRGLHVERGPGIDEATHHFFVAGEDGISAARRLG